LRQSHPATPILLLDQRRWPNAAFIPEHAESIREKTAALTQAYEKLKSAGDANLHYRAGDDLLGADGEATVDGSHPTDLGMMRYADALEPTLRQLLT
jgi:lysophospholipase L1-like esterase